MFLIRWIVVLFLILVSLATWIPKIRLVGVVPDLFLGVVFLVALRRGLSWGVWAGFLIGLLVAVEQPEVLGTESLALVLAALATSQGARNLDRRDPLIMIFLLFLSALAAEAVRSVASARGDPAGAFFFWIRFGIPGALYTVLAVPALSWALARLIGRKDWLLRAP